MSDLRGALALYSDPHFVILEVSPELKTIVEAASRWADLMEQEPIWWCMTHGRTDDTGLDCSMVYDCRMVRVRLAQEEPR